uniref:Complex I-B16.6 n=1 Tax=Globodera pallida TaxID=36090 RepID=A0A183BNE8_GLOPA
MSCRAHPWRTVANRACCLSAGTARRTATARSEATAGRTFAGRTGLSKNCAVPMDYDKLKKFGLRYCNINRTGPHIAMTVLAGILIGVTTQGEYIRIYWEGKMAKWRKTEDKSVVALTN